MSKKEVPSNASSLDIAQRKQTESELRQSIERLQALMEEIPTGVVNVDIKGKITYVNKTILQATGYSREELVGKNGLKLGLIPPETLKLLGKRMKEKLMGKPPSPVEIQFKRKDGEWMWIEITGRALWEHGVPVGVQVVGQDITERKRAEEALRESEEKLQTYLESAPDGVYINDLKGTFLYGNKKAEELTGYKRQELLGKSFLKLNLLPPTYLAKAGKSLALNAMGKPTGPDEFELTKKDGSRIWVEITNTPIKQGEGKTEIIGFVRDITERKRMEEELREAQEQLARSEKLAAIGQLAGGVGHELRNPLGAIKNAAYYIKGKVAKSELGQKEPRVTEFLDIIDDEINASNKIINDLLGFSRVQKPSVSPARIEKVIEDALSRTAIPENIEPIKKLDSNLPDIEVDPDQIEQVLVNMITNAVQAMPEGGKLAIGAREKGGFLEVEVADTGCGIPEESVDKIFDPLFTTRAKGIGLGLAVCKAIIDSHEGNIEVKSKIGKGTMLNVKLPLKRE